MMLIIGRRTSEASCRTGPLKCGTVLPGTMQPLLRSELQPAQPVGGCPSLGSEGRLCAATTGCPPHRDSSYSEHAFKTSKFDCPSFVLLVQLISSIIRAAIASHLF